MIAGDFDVCKTSFHAALSLTEQTVVLPCGSALGFGVGPLLLAAHDDQRPDNPTQVTLCPGNQTTATLLFKLFYPDSTKLQQTVFSNIMPSLKAGKADFGVCIHEGRFTWKKEGLFLVEDLGERWEEETKSPLPLGGIVARRSLGEQTIQTVNAVIHDSLQHAREDPERALPTMQQHAQELDDEVLLKHVDLYVNDWTLDLGQVGSQALETLSQMAKSIGLVQESCSPIEVFGG